MAHAGVEKTLIVGPAWVGDMVMSHTLVQLLAAADPRGEIHMAAPSATTAVAERMAEISRVHTLEFRHGELGLGKRRQAGRVLRELGYTRAYVLPNSWKSALVPWFAGIHRRVGWHGEARYGLLNDRRRLDEAAYPLMIERFMALADPDGMLPPSPYPEPRLQADPDNVSRLGRELGLDRGGVALCPGAEFGAAKKWPARHYADLAAALLEERRDVWLLGSPNDVEESREIAALVPGVTNLAGRTSLSDAIDVLSLASAAVCNDSGLMHIACALGVPTVGIFGSTSPGFTPPLGAGARVVSIDLDCRPCFERECPLGHLRCLNDIPAQRVLEALSE